MTPGELNKLAKAVADLLAREGNEALSAEELAEEITSEVISLYEEIQTKSYNLIVLGHFTTGDGEHHVSAVGPLSTRAVQRARGIGEHFAWDYKTRKGTGKFVLVPLVRNPSEAWDEARRGELAEYEHILGSVVPESGEPSYEPMRFELSDQVRSRITADWQMDPEILKRKAGPHCLCGRYTFAARTILGDPVTLGCPCHPERRDSDREGPDRTGRRGHA